MTVLGNYYTKNFTYTKTGTGDEAAAIMNVPSGAYIIMGHFRTDVVMTAPQGWWCRISGGDSVGSNAPINIASLECIGIVPQITDIYANVIGLSAGAVVTGFIRAIRIK